MTASPLKASDVVFSFLQLKEKGHPQLAFPLAELVSAKVMDEHTVQIRYSGDQSAHAILATSSIPDAVARFLHAAPFRFLDARHSLVVGALSGRQVRGGALHRIPSGRRLLGRRLCRRSPASTISTWSASISSRRARQLSRRSRRVPCIGTRSSPRRPGRRNTTFPALAEGKVVKAEFPEEKRPTMQAWALNQRRKRFQGRTRAPGDRPVLRLRMDEREDLLQRLQAFAVAVRKIGLRGVGQARRGRSSTFSSRSKSEVPARAFGPAVMQPVSDGSGHDRSLLKKAYDLLGAAG